VIYALGTTGGPHAAFSPTFSARAITAAGQMSYDLRRLRVHGLITRIPRSHR
jgi:hypothetical protein